MALKPNDWCLYRKREIRRHGRHREEFHVKTEAEIGAVLPLTKEFQGLSATTES